MKSPAMKRHYAKVIGYLPMITIYAFAEPVYYRITEGLYHNKQLGVFFPDNPTVVSGADAHSYFALFWVFIILFQAYSGAFQSTLMRYHRCIGNYVAPIVFSAMVITSVRLVRSIEEFSTERGGWTKLSRILQTCCGMAMMWSAFKGYASVKFTPHKDVESHMFWMVTLIFQSFIPSLQRVPWSTALINFFTSDDCAKNPGMQLTVKEICMLAAYIFMVIFQVLVLIKPRTLRKHATDIIIPPLLYYGVAVVVYATGRTDMNILHHFKLIFVDRQCPV